MNSGDMNKGDINRRAVSNSDIISMIVSSIMRIGFCRRLYV